MDREDFERRIRVYLDLDVPDVGHHDVIAAALADRMFQYVRQPIEQQQGESPTLRSLLLGERVLFYFSAQWDGSAPGYRATLGDVGGNLGRRVVDVDVDDPVGAGLARLFNVLNTPCVVDSALPQLRVIGARRHDELMDLFGGSARDH